MQKVIVVVGPTASGKSKLAVELAKKFNGEIISGDAYQCYKELSIGSAKVTNEEMQGIPHYLIDVVGYREEYNVKIFQEKARMYIDDIISRGKMPIICGGTGLYIKSLLYDYTFLDEEVDEEYKKELEQLDNGVLFKKLQELDLRTSREIHPNNRQRVIRALMIAHSGKIKSEVEEAQEHKLLYDAKVIGLTMNRERLYDKINERVLVLMKQGLLQEVESIVTTNDDFKLQSMQGIGYKEWLAYFEKEASIDEVVEKIQKNTRNFAKRQYTWFHNQMDVTWYDVEEDSYIDKICEDVKTWV